MVDQISAVQTVTPPYLGSIKEPSNTQQVADINKTDKDTATHNNATKIHEAYKVTLSKLAQVHALKQSGTSVNAIAAKLGLTTAEVDATLSIEPSTLQGLNAEALAAAAL